MSFDYFEPATLDEALGHIADRGDDAVVVAGGSAVAVLSRLGLARPRQVISLRRLGELRGIAAGTDGVTIGALTTLREVETSPLVRTSAASLASTCATVATVRIRQQATLGGNVAHADPAQDPPPTLIALGAIATVAGTDGRREIPLDGFFTSWFTTVLQPDELLVGLRVPAAAAGTRATYLKFLPRTADDYATVSVAATAQTDADGRVTDATIVLGSVGPTPMRARRAERALIDRVPSAADLDDVAALVRDDIDPIDDARGRADYKQEMARVWTARALRQVVGQVTT